MKKHGGGTKASKTARRQRICARPSPFCPPPPRGPGLRLGAEPSLALRRVDARLRVRLSARHVVDARVLPADVPLETAIAHAARRGLNPFPAPPARGLDEVASPHTPAGRLRRRLVRDVVGRVLPLRHRPPLLDHPSIHIGTVDAAHRDDTAIAVAVALGALNRPAGEAPAKRPGGGFAARPSLAAGAAALRRLRSVDAVEPDALRLNPERVAVDRRS